MANILTNWSNLTDSVGRKINEYTLSLNRGGIIDWMPKMYAFGVDLGWNVFMTLVALAATFLSWVGNPSWLDWLDETYRNLTENMFSIINPLVLATLGFALLMFFILLDSVKSNTTTFDKNDYNRIAAGFSIMVCIGVLVANPFAILKAALSVVHAGVATIAGETVTNYSVFSVDAMIRQPTLIITYNSSVDEKCADLWSTVGSLPDDGSCFPVGGNTPSAITMVLVVLSLFMAVCAGFFAAVAVWKYLKHLTVAVLGFVSLPWVAAVSMFRRRQFDQLGSVAAVAGGNMLMVFIVQIIALGGPALVSELMSGWGQGGAAVLQLFAMAITYMVLSGIIVAATRRNGAIVRALRADTSTALRTYMGSPGAGINMGGSTSLRQTWHEVRGKGANIYRQLQGKSAEVNKKEKDGVDQLDKVQQTSQVPDPTFSRTEAIVREFIPTNAVTRFAIAKWDKRKGRGGRKGVGVIEGTAEELKRTLPGVDGVRGEAALRNTASKPNVRATEDELKTIRELVDGLSGDGDEKALDALFQYLMAHDLIDADNPVFGGRTPEPMVREIVTNTAIDILNQVITTNMFHTAAPAETVAVTVSGDQISATQRFFDHEREYARRSDAGGAVLNQPVGLDGVQSTVRGGAPGKEFVLSQAVQRFRVRERQARNAYRGSPVTRGDVAATKNGSQPITDRADDEALMEHVSHKLRARGENGVIAYTDDPVHDVRFTPDHPTRSVSPAVGVGFGDNIVGG